MTSDKDLFRQHRKLFVPFWFTPVFLIATVVVHDFTGSKTLIRIVGSAAAVWAVVTFLRASVIYRRRTGRVLTPRQTLMWAWPFLGLWCLLIMVRAVVFGILGRPL